MANQRDGDRPREKPQQIADALRALIVSGELSEGESLGREPDLVEQFGVSRPSLREALRILEAEGLITVKRGVAGGVIVHQPDERMTGRTAALVLQARNVSLADVFQARSLLEPLAVKAIAALPHRRIALAELHTLVEQEEGLLADPAGFGVANAEFHQRLMSLGGNQTLAVVTEMLNEVVARAVAAISTSKGVVGSLSTRRRSVRSQRRLLELLEAGDATAAEAHWRAHMAVVGRLMLGQEAATVVDLLHHYA